MHYWVGRPFWKIAGRAGVPLQLVVRIRQDVEAGVFVADSPDLDGLVVEAETLEALRLEVESAATELLELAISGHSHQPDVRYEIGGLCAA